MTMGNVWNKVTSNQIIKWVNSKKKGYLGRLAQLPFFSLMLPVLSDVFMMMLCVVASGSPNDIRVALKLLKNQYKNQPILSFLIDTVGPLMSECLGSVMNVIRINVFDTNAWTNAFKCIAKLASFTPQFDGLSVVRKGILTIFNETLRVIFGYNGMVKEIAVEISAGQEYGLYPTWNWIMWHIGLNKSYVDEKNNRALLKQFSGLTQFHSAATLLLLYSASQLPFNVFSWVFKAGFAASFIVAKSTMASLGVLSSKTLLPTGLLVGKGLEFSTGKLDELEGQTFKLIKDMEKSGKGESILTFVRRFLIILKPIYLNAVALHSTFYVMQQWWDQIFGCLLSNLVFGVDDNTDTQCCLAKFRKEIQEIDRDKKDEDAMKKLNFQFDDHRLYKKYGKEKFKDKVAKDYTDENRDSLYRDMSAADRAIIATNRAWKSFRNTNIAQAILNAKMEEQRGQRSDLLGIDTPKSPVFNGLDQYDEAIANAESDSEYFKGFKSRLGDLTRQVGPKETFFLICSKHPVESLCESVFGEAPDSVLLKQIYEFIWETRYADDTRRYKLYRAFRPVVLRDMQLNSTAPVPEPEPEPEPFGLSSLFGLLGFQDNPARVVSNDVPGDGNCFFYALFRALAHKDFPYLDQLQECFGIDTTSERVFAENMRQLIANAFDGFMSPQINNLADQSAMVYYQAVYLSRENDANSMTCIPSQRGLSFDAYKQLISQRVRAASVG